MSEFPLAARETTIARGLNLNLTKLVTGSALEPREAYLALLAVARAAGYEDLAAQARDKLSQLGTTEPEIREAEESVAIMAMLTPTTSSADSCGIPRTTEPRACA